MAEDQTESDKGRHVRSVLDNLADNFRDWTTTATEKAGKLTRVAAEKAEELGKLGKLKLDIFQLQRERQKALSALGLKTFTALTGKTAADWEKRDAISGLIDRVHALDIDIAAKEAEATRSGGEPVKAESRVNGKEKHATGKPKKATAKKPKTKTTTKKNSS